MPKNKTDIHRLIWSPDDIQDGKVLPSAIRKADLKGNGAYVSVSRIDQICEDAEISMASNQAGRADGIQVIRDEAMSALLNCGEVRRLQDTEKGEPFEVRAEPLKENQAHCGIHNVSGEAGRGYIGQLRTLLVETIRETIGLEELFKRLKENGE